MMMSLPVYNGSDVTTLPVKSARPFEVGSGGGAPASRWGGHLPPGLETLGELISVVWRLVIFPEDLHLQPKSWQPNCSIVLVCTIGNLQGKY